LLYIDRATCAGCAVCVDACPTGAISLDENEGVSTIDPGLCNECLACLDVCPTGAIRQVESSELVPAMGGKAVEGEVIEGEVIPATASRLLVPARSPSRLATLAGAALTFVGNHLLPRAADALVNAVERRLAHGTNPGSSTTPLRPGGKPLKGQVANGGKGHGRQRRRRRRGR
jgi:NAD-dependent dihydropyrimidine dehydrogenase PreA subunit